MNMWTVILAGLLIVTLGSALEDAGVLASRATRGLPTDDKVAIVLKSTKLLLGKCPKGPASTMNVRLQSLKTKSGATFRRKVVSDDAFACVAALGSKPLAATRIQECSKKAEAAGLKMFRWDGGRCTGYTNGIPVNIARCPGAGSVVLYSLDVPAIKSPVVSNIKVAFSVNNAIDASWDAPSNSCFVAAYRVSFNNVNTFVSPKLATATVSLATARPCAEYNLTVTPVDASHAVMGTAATVKVVVPKARELSLNLTYGVTAVRASWEAKYTCNPTGKHMTGEPIKTYSISFGGVVRDTNNSTFEITFPKAPRRCTDAAGSLSDDYKEVTLKAFDGSNAEVASVTTTLMDTIMPGHRYSMPYANCFYYQTLAETPGGVGYTYDEVQNFCQKTMLSTPYTGAANLADYTRDLTDLANRSPSIIVPPHYVGLIRDTASGKWMWSRGTEQPASDAAWDAGEPSSAGDCAQLNANSKLAAVSCATPLAVVCVDIFA